MERTRKNQIIWGISVIFTIMAFIAIISSLLVPWYQYNYNDENNITINEEYSLFEKRFEYQDRYDHYFDSISYQEGYQVSYYSNLMSLFNTTVVIIVIAFCFSLFFLVCLLIASFEKTIFKIVITLGFIVIICSLYASVFMMMSLPSSLKSDLDKFGDRFDEGESYEHFYDAEHIKPSPTDQFIGSGSDANRKASWGPVLGWYLPIFAFLFIIVSMVASFHLNGEKKPVFTKRYFGGYPRNF